MIASLLNKVSSRSRLVGGAFSLAALLGAASAGAAVTPGYWALEPESDPYSASALFDMRSLSEPVAGQSGWVTAPGDDFLLGNGTPVRFWSITSGVYGSSLDNARTQMKFFAKRGINLVRWHTSVYNNSAASLATVNTGSVDNLHRLVKAAKEQGIYTKISFFFVLGLRINPAWGIDGYDSAWIAANDDSPTTEPDWAVNAPFGLIFFDQNFKDAYKNWISTILTRPNPYDGNKKLADERAVAIVEIQNEDNLFFWTWNPKRFPLVQQQKINRQFGNFLREKHGSLQAAVDSWGSTSASIWDSDNQAAGEMTIVGAQYMAPGGLSGTGNVRRMKDQMEFLAKVQYDFHAEMKAYIQDLGYGGTFTATNWTTADNKTLKDTEFWTYTAAGVIDVHNYYGNGVDTKAVFGRVQGGDTYFKIAGVNGPRAIPATHKQVEGHPTFLSESTWTSPHDFRAESALLIGAYGSLVDHDGFTWFASGDPSWQDPQTVWPVAIPGIMGMFPGVSLLYREGYVAEAPTVVREGRSLDSLWERKAALINPTSGWDPTRDPTKEYNYDPETNSGLLDTAAMLVGKVEVAYDGDTDYVSPAVGENIDNPNKTVTSATGELKVFWGQPAGQLVGGVPSTGAGYFTVNAPRAQGATGWLNAIGANVVLDDVQLRLRNTFGTILVVPLDGLPIRQSSKLLVQAIAADQPTGWATQPKTVSWSGKSWQGKEVLAAGGLPYEIEEINGQVRLVGAKDRVTAVKTVDTNGYFQADNTTGRAFLNDYLFDLPRTALYTVVELAPLADYTPVIVSKALPNGKKNTAYSAQVQVAGGDGAITFSAEGLPNGLSMDATGLVSGTPPRGGAHTVAVTVTDADGDTQTRELPLAILPVNDGPPCDSIFQLPTTYDLGGGWKWGPLGYLYDGYYPFVWSLDYGSWLYVFNCASDSTEAGGYYLYDFKLQEFGFTQTAYYPWYFIIGGPNQNTPIQLVP